MTLGRRHLLFAAAGLTGATLAAPRGTPSAGGRLDLADPRVAVESYVKLRGSTRDETVFQPYDGDIFAVVDGEVSVPLVGFRGLQKSIWRRVGDGAWVNKDYDLGFYVDYASREVLERWRNPLTGVDVEVYHYRGGPSGGRFAVGEATGATLEDPYSHLGGRWSVAGDQVWYTASFWGDGANPLPRDEFPESWSGERVDFSMSTTYAGSLAALADPRVREVSSAHVWSNTSSWMPWLQMGQRPGHAQWRWIGAKGAAPATLDPLLVDSCERAWPGYVTRNSTWKTPTTGWRDFPRQRRGQPLTD